MREGSDYSDCSIFTFCRIDFTNQNRKTYCSQDNKERLALASVLWFCLKTKTFLVSSSSALILLHAAGPHTILLDSIGGVGVG